MPTLIAALSNQASPIQFVYYTWRSTGNSITPVGRGVNPGLNIPGDDSVSRFHLRIVEAEGEYYAEASPEAKNEVEAQLNGAWVPLSTVVQSDGRYRLVDGEWLLVGRTQVQFVKDGVSEHADDFVEARRLRAIRNARTLERVRRGDLEKTEPAGPMEPGWE